MRKSFAKIFSAIFTVGFVATLGFLSIKFAEPASAVHAAFSGFDAGNIITDYVMSDSDSMDEAAISNFLLSKNSCNATADSRYASNKVDYFSESSTYSWHVKDGYFVCLSKEDFNGETAAHIIYQAAQDYHINPKVLIVLLEKEQGLITDVFPNSVQYRSATGYGCPDTAACDAEYYGFKNQVRNAAYFFRYILDNGSRYYPTGDVYVKYNPNSSCGGSTVNIQNRATSALYQYTPYQPNDAVLNAGPGAVVTCGAYGNANFYYYYTSWFGDTHANLSSIYLPDGDYSIKTNAGKYLAPSGSATGSSVVIKSTKSTKDYTYHLTRDGDYYTITHVSSGKVLDVINSSTTNGTGVQLYPSDGTCAQKWYINLVDGAYSIRSACSTKALDVPGGSTSKNNLAVQIYDYNGTIAQLWTLTALDSAPVADGTYVIATPGDKAIDIEAGHTENGTRNNTYDLTYSGNQQFTFTRAEDGFYEIKNVASGRVMDVAGRGKDNGTAVQLWDHIDSNCGQKWTVLPVGDRFALISACSDRALDVPGGNVLSNYQRLQIYDRNGTAAQNWAILPLNPLADGNYEIASALNSGSVLDIAGGSDAATDGTNLQIWNANSTAAQKYSVTYDRGAGAYTIKNLAANRALDVAGGGTMAGTNVHVWEYNSTCSQFWHLYPRGEYYNLISACSNMTLDADGGSTAPGTNAQIWWQNGTDAQKWKFTRI